jgi:hypothetical protein
MKIGFSYGEQISGIICNINREISGCFSPGIAGKGQK